MAVGYTNASWTLRADLSARWFCSLLHHLDRHGLTVATPRYDEPEAGERPLLDLTSGYVQRAAHLLPRQGRAAGRGGSCRATSTTWPSPGWAGSTTATSSCAEPGCGQLARVDRLGGDAGDPAQQRRTLVHRRQVRQARGQPPTATTSCTRAGSLRAAAVRSSAPISELGAGHPLGERARAQRVGPRAVGEPEEGERVGIRRGRARRADAGEPPAGAARRRPAVRSRAAARTAPTTAVW